MHLFFESEKTDPHARPDITIRISPAEMDIRTPKGDYVDIVKKEDKRNSMMSYLWDNKVEKCYRLRFAKRDSQEEFMDYVKKLMALGT